MALRVGKVIGGRYRLIAQSPGDPWLTKEAEQRQGKPSDVESAGLESYEAIDLAAADAQARRKRVVIKILSPSASAQDVARFAALVAAAGGVTPEQRTRGRRVAALGGGLTEDGSRYMVLEFAELRLVAGRYKLLALLRGLPWVATNRHGAERHLLKPSEDALESYEAIDLAATEVQAKRKRVVVRILSPSASAEDVARFDAALTAGAVLIPQHKMEVSVRGLTEDGSRYLVLKLVELRGKYQLIEQVGAGGLGAVWRAHAVELDRECAIKLPALWILDEAGWRDRFEAEARLLAKVRHRHVVAVYDVDGHEVEPDRTVPFFVMEMLHGESLATRLERGALSPEETCEVIEQVGLGLSAAHAHGIVHRDLKPENVLLALGGTGSENNRPVEACLIDFGIAKSSDPHSIREYATTVGAVIGTQGYKSPEQRRALTAIDGRSDLWTLAVVALECVSGIRPGDDASLFFRAALSALPSAVAPAVTAWWAKATQQEPDDRFQSAAELVDGLRSGLQPAFGAPEARRPVAPPPRVLPNQRELENARTELQVPAPAGPLRRFAGRMDLMLLVGAGLVVVFALPVLRRTVLGSGASRDTLRAASAGTGAPRLAQAGVGGSVASEQVRELRREHDRGGERPQSAPTDVAVATRSPSAVTNAHKRSSAPDNAHELQWGLLADEDEDSDAALVTHNGRVELVQIPGGTFWMGSEDTDKEAYADERPRHQVTLRAFEIGKYEVTNEEYARYLTATGAKPPAGWKLGLPRREPVRNVTYLEAEKFAEWAGGRLPTEAEFEYVARGWKAGQSLDEVAWYSGNSEGRVHEVGRKAANRYGVYDMLGNVWEWCSDWYGPYSANSASDPSGTSEPKGRDRVLRGGSYDSGAWSARPAARFRYLPVDRFVDRGFRLARGRTGNGD